MNTEVFSTLSGYTDRNVQERPEDAEKDACITLKELEKLIVRYIVDNYNQRIDAPMGEQTRFQRWESGLLSVPDTISERELDICLMKQSRRRVQKGGHLQFENLIYKGEYLGGYEGETILIRYDPRDITVILIYRFESNKEVFLTRAYAMDLEMQSLSLSDAKASAKRVRDAGKNLSNRTVLMEIEDRSNFTQKKTKKQRQKEEQEQVKPSTPSPVLKEEMKSENESMSDSSFSDDDLVEVIDYEQLSL